ncbi:hypothetical protein K503DRAFT_459697 [Rhizopogon vinicolor AM-OR11-026]|uniref:Uncharacterized protein n=1 Tax=Rhizopogon vinicolor AM-OR11-026 TaxID=1314800 RepID=A0A1B7MNT9_9AGAM|nr:hypothetical protein K503DRAFT_459697 [Rhizopogon vinicolor AM-OR11-026]
MLQIFLVYTALNQKPMDHTGPDGFRSLEHIDSRKDILSIRFEFTALSHMTSSPSGVAEDNSASKSRNLGKSARRTRSDADI